jgi:hypothetical protein
MALWFDIKIGTERIASVEIVRARPTHNETDLDAVSTYQWTYTRDEGLPGATGYIDHRYGDGAIALAHKVLGLIAERHRIAAEMKPDA